MALAAALLVAGCSGAQQGEASAASSSTLWVRAVDSSALEGQWAARWTTVTETPAPLGATVRSTQRRIALVALREQTTDAGEVHVAIEGRVCDLDVESSTSLASTLVPDAYVQALPPVSLRGVRREEHLEIFPSVETIGAEVAPGEALPRDVDDPRVRDSDGDGHPGVTVRVQGMSGGDMYFVQRREAAASLHFEGQRWAGLVTWSVEQHVLDATSNRLRQERDTRVSDDPNRHRLELVPVSADTPCEEAASVF